MEASTLILLVIIGVILYLLLCRNSELFGQDPSIRASSGWLAGPSMYGYDPITVFANQIDEMKADPREYAQKYWGGGESSALADEWRWRLSQSPNLMSQPAGEVGPVERHPPYILKEKYTPPVCDNDPQKECFSCMSTEEIERLQK